MSGGAEVDWGWAGEGELVDLVADFGGEAEEGGGLAGTSGSVVGIVAHFGVSNGIIGCFCNPLTTGKVFNKVGRDADNVLLKTGKAMPTPINI